MSFAAILYHEIREGRMMNVGETSPIDVNQDYDDNLPAPLFNSLENFAAQMKYLYDNGFHTLTLSEIKSYYYDHKPLPEKSVLLTFDDCYQSVGLYVYPILKKYQFNAALFVVTDWINRSEKPFDPNKSVCMSEAEIAAMSDVFEYANHTHSFHVRENETTSKIMTATDEEIIKDLTRCNAHNLIQAKDIFAYPFGLYADRNVAVLREQGFKLAFTCIPGKNDNKTDPLLLKRNIIPYFMEIGAFRAIVE